MGCNDVMGPRLLFDSLSKGVLMESSTLIINMEGLSCLVKILDWMHLDPVAKTNRRFHVSFF
jgi:hypothetical protein